MSNSLGPHGLQDAYHLYVESKKKKKYKWTYLQNRNKLTEKKLMVTKEEKELGEELGAWD